MIYRTFFKSIYELCPIEEDYKKLNGKKVGRIFEYTAASNSIIIHLGATFLHIAVGKDVEIETLKNLVSVALKHKKPVKLEFCESLGNLQLVDQVVLQINTYLGFKDILI
jgi:hypothetical protein